MLKYPVCQPCVKKIKRVYPKPPKGLDAIFCAGVFEGELKELIHLFKYQKKEYLADFFGEFCQTRWGLPLDRVDALVAIPSTFWRILRRGYNPTHLLASTLSKKWKIPLERGCLVRRNWRPSQTRLKRRERLFNAKGSYRLGYGPLRPKGETVLLIDDVFTTGATLSSCANLLKSIGYQHVWAATIAFDPLLLNKKLSDRIASVV